MSFFITSLSKTVVTLKESDDWDEWFLIIEAMIKRENIQKYTNLIKIESAESIKSVTPTFFSVRPDAAFSKNLTKDERRDLIIMREDHREKLRTYRERTEALKQLNVYILITVDRSNLLYLKEQNTIFRKLSALKKRLAPTNRIRKLEVVRKYRDLQRAPKNQQLDHWLLNWEKVYSDASALNLSDVQRHRCLFDFLNSLRSIDMTFVTDKEAILNYELQQRKEPSFIRDLLKEFRNHLRITRALIKKSTHSAFATLQENPPSDDSKDEDFKDSKTSKNFKNSSKNTKKCLCESNHSLRECLYIMISCRSSSWKPNPKIEKTVNEKMSETKETFKWLLDSIKKKDAANMTKKSETLETNKSETSDKTDSNSSSSYSTFVASSIFAASSVFAVETAPFELQNCWTLNCETDIHVCNDSHRFQQNRTAHPMNRLRAEKNIYSIENYDTMNIVTKESRDPVNIKLTNVALAPEFLTNLVCLSRLTSKGIHWDTEKSHLHTKNKTFCYTQPVGGHWVIERNAPRKMYDAYAAHSEKSKPDLVASKEEWHAMLSHPESETIANLEKGIDGIKMTNPKTASSTMQCETCALSKTHQIVSRRSDQDEVAKHPLDRIDYDLIQMSEDYNDDKWISHFVCFLIGMKFVYTHERKNDALSIIREFVKLTLIRYEQTVRFIRIDDEQTLSLAYDDFMKMRGISTERSTPYIPAQNEKTERSERVLIIRARTLRISARLSTNMWSEVFKAIDYLNNRTPKKSLNWKTPMKTLTEDKPKLSHLQSYECRAYALKHNIPRKDKLKPRAHIDHLVEYDFINVFRIWILSRMRIIRIRDVIFDKANFYDLSQLDLSHILEIFIDDEVQMLKISETTFGEVIIEQKDDENIITNQLTSDSTIMKDASDLHTDMNDDSTANAENLHIDMKKSVNNQNPQILTSEMTPNRDVQSTTTAPADSVIMNTRSRSRRQTYVTALTSVDDLRPYYAAFSIDLQRPENLKVPKLHRDEISTKPRYWKQMLHHQFSQKFQSAAAKKLTELEKKRNLSIDEEATESDPNFANVSVQI